MNIVKHMPFLPFGTSSGYMPSRGIVGFYGSSMSCFLRNSLTDFQSSCISFQSKIYWRSLSLSPHPRQHLLSPEFLILAIMTSVRCILIKFSKLPNENNKMHALSNKGTSENEMDLNPMFKEIND